MASATLILNPLSPPSGGSCRVTPRSGIAFITKFNVTCSGYAQGQASLKFKFSVKEKGTTSCCSKCKSAKIKIMSLLLTQGRLNLNSGKLGYEYFCLLLNFLRALKPGNRQQEKFVRWNIFWDIIVPDICFKYFQYCLYH